MSVGAITYSQVICDGCGAVHPPLEQGAMPAKGATSARIAAAMEGWKFTEYPECKRNEKGPRLWDACPACDLPETFADAKALRSQGPDGDAR